MDAPILAKLDKFFSRYPLRKYDQDQLIVHAGDEPPGVMYLLSGQVRQYDISASGEEVVVNVFKPPSYFFMSWAINRTTNQYFYNAFRDSEVRVAPPDEIIAFLKTNPEVVFDLLSRLYSGLEGMQRRMAHLMGGNAFNRVLFELIIEFQRFGQKKEDGSTQIDLHVSEIAKRAGLTRETASRELKKLTAKKLIKVNRSGLVVEDVAVLIKMLDDKL